MSRAFLTHPITDDSAIGGSVIKRSLRFNDSDGAFLQRTPSSAGNRKKWTFSAWIKRVKLGTEQRIFGGDANASHIFISTDDKFRWDLANEGSGSASGTLRTNAVFRDSTSWYHLVCAYDADNSTANNRMRMYVNGTEITSFAARTNPSSGYATNAINATSVHTIGRRTSAQGTDGMRFDGYMTEINFIDGQQYDPSFFGYTEFQTGIWRPKKYEGAYGTNGFYLECKDNSSTSALGKDTSGNGHDFTTYNFSVSAGDGNDSLEDTPTNNFCTISELDRWRTNTSVTDGGLKFTRSANNFGAARGNFAVNKGKWYFEFTKGSGLVQAGIVNTDYHINYNGGDSGLNSSGSNPCGIAYDSRGTWYGYTGSSPSSIGNGDVIGVAFDADNFKFYFHKNGTYYASANPSTETNGIQPNASNTITKTDDMFFAPYFNGENGNGYANFGQRPFAHTPPSGFKALNSKNLPINLSSIIRPQKHFDTLLYTGDGSSSRRISGLQFPPDFIWVKNRSQGFSSAVLDSVRGGNKRLRSDSSAVEDTSSNSINSFNTDGWTMDANDAVNQNSSNFCGWCWKAGGTAVSNTDGDVTSQVSVNEEAGFSIVSFTTPAGSGFSIGHGLSKAPEVILMKNRDYANNWDGYHHKQDLTNPQNYRIILNSTDDREAQPAWDNTAPTSTVFRTRGGNNWYNTGHKIIAYCWYSIPGFSRFGRYKGNGNNNGPYVQLGFRPALLIIKRIENNEDWWIQDSKRNPLNPLDKNLYPNDASAEATADVHDLCSDGFKIRTSNINWNATNDTYVYWAFAEQPGNTAYQTNPNPR